MQPTNDMKRLEYDEMVWLCSKSGSSQGGRIAIHPKGVLVFPSHELFERKMLKNSGLKGTRDLELLRATVTVSELLGSHFETAPLRALTDCADFLRKYAAEHLGESPTWEDGRPRLIASWSEMEHRRKARACRLLEAEFVACIAMLDAKRAEKLRFCITMAASFKTRQWLAPGILNPTTQHIWTAIEALAVETKAAPTKSAVRQLAERALGESIAEATFNKDLKELGFDWLPRARPWHGQVG